MKLRFFALSVAIGLVLSAQAGAIFAPRESKRVPIDRLVANLERRVAANPKDVQAIVNLARLHAMAYALKVDDFPAVEAPGSGDDVPFYAPRSPQAPDAVRPAPDAGHAARAAQHLKAAIRHYEAALKLAPDNITARLGYGWVLEQSGNKAAAIREYREVVAQAWPTEQNVKALMPSQRFLTQEAIDYLLPLLDPAKDAAEIKDLMAKQDVMRSRPRAVTPVAIPLVDDLRVANVIDMRARVRFDADGSGLDREWTWITPKAGWLVYDADGGRITSALQLFGNVSFWLFWTNGYEPMRALDDNDDGELAGEELKHLAVWNDSNSNGISDPGELASLSSHGIVALSCEYEDGDGANVAARSISGVRLTDGRTRPTYDVILHRAASTLTRR